MCNDCGCHIMKGNGCVGILVENIRIYKGPPICGVCSNTRYNHYVRKEKPKR